MAHEGSHGRRDSKEFMKFEGSSDFSVEQATRKSELEQLPFIPAAADAGDLAQVFTRPNFDETGHYNPSILARLMRIISEDDPLVRRHFILVQYGDFCVLGMIASASPKEWDRFHRLWSLER